MHGLVGVSALVWACGCGVGVVRVWVMVVQRGLSLLLVHPVLCLIGVALQFLLLSMDAVSFFYWVSLVMY